MVHLRMTPIPCRPRGFALIELLVVVTVLLILVGGYMGQERTDPQATTYRQTVGRANDAACLANRATLRTAIELFRMENPGVPITTENLTARGVQVPVCPDGGAYGWTREGQILCNRHGSGAFGRP
jgi:prepilin-type N-terminal cleavage/methylation domain-containing protein